MTGKALGRNDLFRSSHKKLNSGIPVPDSLKVKLINTLIYAEKGPCRDAYFDTTFTVFFSWRASIREGYTRGASAGIYILNVFPNYLIEEISSLWTRKLIRKNT